MLTLAGSNAFSGPTTISGGTLTLAPGASLSGATSVTFAGNTLFNIGPNNQAITGLTVADSFTGTVTGVGSLTVNATGSMLIGGANPNQTQTLVMSNLGAFNYNGSNNDIFDAGSQYTGTALPSIGAGTVWLAASNAITASRFGVASNGSYDEVTTNVSTGLVYLGQTNVINASTVEVAYNNFRSSANGTLEFAPGSVNPTLGLYGIGGPGSRAEVTVGFIGASSYSQFATGTIDLVAGVTGTSVLTGYVDPMILGFHDYNNNGHPATGIFNMGGGTLDANSISIGDLGAGTVAGGNATGTFSLNGGAVLAGQINLGVFTATAGTAGGTFNLNSGLVSAAAISSGSGSSRLQLVQRHAHQLQPDLRPGRRQRREQPCGHRSDPRAGRHRHAHGLDRSRFQRLHQLRNHRRRHAHGERSGRVEPCRLQQLQRRHDAQQRLAADGRPPALGVGSLTMTSGTLDLNGNNTAIGSLFAAAGLITDNSPATGTTTLTVNQTAAATFGGTLQDGATGRSWH